MSLIFWTRSRTFIVSIFVGFALALGLTAAGMCDFADTCAVVRGDTLRLHIVASSNSAADQTLKLKVRDAVVAAAGRLCGGAKDKAAAEAALRQNLPLLQHIAQDVTAWEGCPQKAEVRIENSWFATCRYGENTLPAGWYDAVYIRLGAGRGHNWWCCLYPAMCLSASGAHYEKPAEQSLVTGDYEIRFACVEWWEKIRRDADEQKSKSTSRNARA